MLLRVLFVALSFLFFVGDAAAGIDVNSATARQLESLPGIGPSKAGQIVSYREENGPFGNLSDLDKVPGIGPATLANIGVLVEFGEGSAPSSAPAHPSTEGAHAASDPKPRRTPARRSSGSPININTASAAQLDALPGIGPSKAAAILGDREANGPFSSCDDLKRVTGIGKATVASLAESCSVGAP